MLSSRNSGLVHSALSPAEYRIAALSAVLSKTLWCPGQVAATYPEGTVMNVVCFPSSPMGVAPAVRRLTQYPTDLQMGKPMLINITRVIL